MLNYRELYIKGTVRLRTSLPHCIPLLSSSPCHLAERCTLSPWAGMLSALGLVPFACRQILGKCMVSLGPEVSKCPPHTPQRCCYLPAFSCSFWWEANRSSKYFSPSPLRAFKFKIRIKWKNSTEQGIFANHAASSLMKKTTYEEGSQHNELIATSRQLLMWFPLSLGLLSPKSPTSMPSCEWTHLSTQVKKLWSGSISYWWEKSFPQHRGKTTTKFNRAVRLLASIGLFLGYQEMIIPKGVTHQI